MRTAQAFGTQHILSERYDSHIEKAKQSDMKAAIFHGCGLAAFFFVIYGGYGLGPLGFSFARLDGLTQCFFSILFRYHTH